jgi:RNA polymerase sigma-70 factor (ECF subfamily)
LVAVDTDRWALLAAHRDRLVRVADRRLSPGGDPEDCAHDALLRCDTITEVDPEHVGALLTTIVVRLCIDTERRTRAGAAATARYAARRAVETDAIEQVDDDAEARWLASLVDTLAPIERAVVRARADGHTVGETAERLGLTYKAVEGALTRARRKLRATTRQRGVLRDDH